MNVLLTYDLDGHHYVVKESAKAAGFRDHILSEAGTLEPLPNTTLIVDAFSPEHARAVFLGIAQRHGATVTCLIAADWTRAVMHKSSWRGLLGALLGRAA